MGEFVSDLILVGACIATLGAVTAAMSSYLCRPFTVSAVQRKELAADNESVVEDD